MEEVVDRLIQELDELRETAEFEAVLTITTETKLDDPGLVIVDEYPYMYVAPVTEQPRLETIGLAGYDVILLNINIGVVINMADFFDPSVSEVSGTRELMQASKLIRRRLRRLSKRQLDGLSGVRNLIVQSVNYVPDIRDGTFIKLALLDIVVERQYAHED